MKVLLLAGLGPYFKQAGDLAGSLFDPSAAGLRAARAATDAASGLDPHELVFNGPDGVRHRLLRPERSGSLSLSVDNPEIDRTPIPNLTAGTLLSILRNADIDHEFLSLDHVWDGDGEPSSDAFDYVLLSTTFICDRGSLARAIAWSLARMPDVPIVVGGQFSNLKYATILHDHPAVVAIVRGDGELALPLLLRALHSRQDLSSIPNLVFRSPIGSVASTGVSYVDIETYPAPSFPGKARIVPYESMRGCPFSCKFCSFPAASPLWRYKSAQRIVADWSAYRDVNGASHVRALDSTFTVPRTRFAELLELLPSVGIGWEAFTRANLLSDAGIVDALARANCRTLSIGFESMSDNSLDYMNKQVSAKQNRVAFRLLRGSPVGYRVSFIVGYPGETPEDYLETHQFLVDEYEGHFGLSIFSLQDETMPVWEDAARFKIELRDLDDPDYSWTHSGMDVGTARSLRQQTLRDVRWKNDTAVPFLWQTNYQTPLLPHLPPRENYRAEKLVERIGFLPVDYPDARSSESRLPQLLAELAALGVSTSTTEARS